MSSIAYTQRAASVGKLPLEIKRSATFSQLSVRRWRYASRLALRAFLVFYRTWEADLADFAISHHIHCAAHNKPLRDVIKQLRTNYTL